MTSILNNIMYTLPPHGVGNSGTWVMLEGLFKFDVWGVDQDLISCVQQMALSNVSIE